MEHDNDLDAFSFALRVCRYHVFLLQTTAQQSDRILDVIRPDHPRRGVVAAVDDDRQILESVELLLESADYDVRLFSSAAALMASGGLREIDCVISDVGMPVMDGFELARAVRAVRPGLPVILISGRPDLLNRAPPASRCEYRLLKKPFNGQDLLTAVGDAVRKRD